MTWLTGPLILDLIFIGLSLFHDPDYEFIELTQLT